MRNILLLAFFTLSFSFIQPSVANASDRRPIPLYSNPESCTNWVKRSGTVICADKPSTRALRNSNYVPRAWPTINRSKTLRTVKIAVRKSSRANRISVRELQRNSTRFRRETREDIKERIIEAQRLYSCKRLKTCNE